MSGIRVISKPREKTPDSFVHSRHALTHKDLEAIERAKNSTWEDIDLAWAETEAGREEVRRIKMRKYHYAEYRAGMI